MKRKLTIIALCAFLITNTFAQVQKPMNYAYKHIFLHDINGEVNQLNIVYKYKGEVGSKETLRYKDGLLIGKESTYVKNGIETPASSEKIEYGKNNKISSIKGSNASQTSNISFKYDKNDNIIEYMYQNSTQPTNVEKYLWENNKIKEIKKYEKKSKLISTSTYTYLPSGKIDQIAVLYYYDNAPFIIKYNWLNDNKYSFVDKFSSYEITLDEKDNIREEKSWWNGKNESQTSFKNEKGWATKHIDENGKITTYEYTFDNNNNVTKHTISINGEVMNEWDITYDYK